MTDAGSTALATGSARLDVRGTARRNPRWLAIDTIELAVALGFIALSVWVIVLDLRQVVVYGRSWTGTDGMFVTDQMEYLAWIRDSSHHFLISNLFEIQQTPPDFFQPLVVISGGLAALGVAPWVALLLWKPFAIGGLLLVARSYVHRTVDGIWGRRAALTMALFFVGWGALVADRILHAGLAASLQWNAITNDLSLGFWSWGYSFGLIALTAMMAAVLSYERTRTRGGVHWAPPLLGALASSLHPWQGGTLILVLIGAEAVAWADHRALRLRPLLTTVSIAALPLLYFVVLNRSDPSWKLAQASAHGGFPLWMVAVTLAPLAAPAALAYRARPRGFLATVTRLWPLAALLIFGLSETKLSAAPTHALLGLSIPLAILAVEGVGSVHWSGRLTRRRGVMAAVLAAAILPPTWSELSTAHRVVTPGASSSQASGPLFLHPGERRALDYLARDRRAGGVMSRFYLGTVVPGLTGRHSYVGNFYYTPNFSQRQALTDQLFLGQLGPQAVRSMARHSGARFLLADCRSNPGLENTLSPIVSSVHRFGCASVFVLR